MEKLLQLSQQLVNLEGNIAALSQLIDLLPSKEEVELLNIILSLNNKRERVIDEMISILYAMK